MWILPLVGYLGLALGFGFLTLAIASGLYYLSEVVEEHTVFAKKLLNRLIYVIIGIQAILVIVDRFPLLPSALNIGAHIVYTQNLRRFPIVKLTDPVFIASCVLVLVDHYVWFRHFSAPPPAPKDYNYYAGPNPDLPTFIEIAAFFGLQVWLVPFALFVSLSAGEYVLPSMGSEYATGAGSSFISPGQQPNTAGFDSAAGSGSGGLGGYGITGRKRSGTNTGMAKAAVTGVREWIGETGELMGFWKGERTRPQLKGF